MSESTQKLMKLLENDCPVELLKQEMHLSTRQLIHRLNLLRNKGYVIEQKYYGNGDITATLSRNESLHNHNIGRIYTKKTENDIRILVMSDAHYFHKDQNQKAIDRAYNYCSKHGIHVIFFCGDLIDCMENNKEPIETQAEKFVELYPYDSKIINMCVLGNHDIMSTSKAGIDLKKVIENNRMDIVPINYCRAFVYIKNDQILLFHPMNQFKEKDVAFPLIYRGHSHRMKIGQKIVWVPSVSNVKVENNYGKQYSTFPQVLDTILEFDSTTGKLKTLFMDQIVIEERPYITGEYQIDLRNNLKCTANNLVVDEYPSEVKLKQKTLETR